MMASMLKRELNPGMHLLEKVKVLSHKSITLCQVFVICV